MENKNPLIIKVCGMRDADNIKAVETLHPCWMGFICWPKSKRYVDDTPSYLPECERVGVFVDADIPFIKAKIEQLKLTRIQLHGDESADFVRKVQEEFNLPIIKAISIANKKDIEKASAYHGIVTHILFDTKCKCVGGSGEHFDWSILQHYNGPTPFIIAGGIGKEDVNTLCQLNHPRLAGFDLNSRFEDAPSVKNIDKLNAFFTSVRSNRDIK